MNLAAPEDSSFICNASRSIVNDHLESRELLRALRHLRYIGRNIPSWKAIEWPTNRFLQSSKLKRGKLLRLGGNLYTFPSYGTRTVRIKKIFRSALAGLETSSNVKRPSSFYPFLGKDSLDSGAFEFVSLKKLARD